MTKTHQETAGRRQHAAVVNKTTRRFLLQTARRCYQRVYLLIFAHLL